MRRARAKLPPCNTKTWKIPIPSSYQVFVLLSSGNLRNTTFSMARATGKVSELLDQLRAEFDQLASNSNEAALAKIQRDELERKCAWLLSKAMEKYLILARCFSGSTTWRDRDDATTSYWIGTKAYLRQAKASFFSDIWSHTWRNSYEEEISRLKQGNGSNGSGVSDSKRARTDGINVGLNVTFPPLTGLPSCPSSAALVPGKVFPICWHELFF